MAGYWFTRSTIFANPAVTIARSFTSTFGGISVKSLPNYFTGQFIGLMIGLPFAEWLFGKKVCKPESDVKEDEAKPNVTDLYNKKDLIEKIEEI